MQHTNLWQHLAPADHETFVSSAICWLLDRQGDHGLCDKLLRRLLGKLNLNLKDSSRLTVKAEETEGRDKRFDISVHEDGEPIARFEVKCKTIGSLDQLEKYSANGRKLGRIAFGEWNYKNLEEEHKQEYPLITFSCLANEICQVIEHTSSKTRYFVESFEKHLKAEHEFFEKLRGYLIEETEDSPPKRPTMHRFSQRFYNQLYWHWFQEKCRIEKLLPCTWQSKSERSGVWLASHGKPWGAELSLPKLGLHLPHTPGSCWVHIELHNRTGILSDENCEVGSLQLRICKDKDPEGNRAAIYEGLRNVRTCGFNPPRRRPGRKSSYWTGLKRPLKLMDYRFSKLHELIDLLTPCD